MGNKGGVASHSSIVSERFAFSACAWRGGEADAGFGCGVILLVFVMRSATTLGADAEHAQRVVRQIKVMFGGDGVLNGFEFSGIEFDSLAAFGADQMIVMRMLVIVLVARAPVAETHFTREARIGKQFERAIDGRLSDVRVFLLYEPVEIFARQMLFGAQENVEYKIALRSAFESGALDVAMKNFLLFSHKTSFTHLHVV